MNEEKKNKRGRPRSDKGAKRVVAMRLDDATCNSLIDICKHYNISKAELVEKLIKNQQKLLKNGIDLL